MIRRDILYLIGIIIWGLAIWLILPRYETSQEIIAHFMVWTIILVLYLFCIVVLELIFKKFGDWDSKKLF